MDESRNPLAPKLFLLVGLATVGAAIYLVGPHASYYLQPVALRALRNDHELLRPSGQWGLSFGLLATALILLNLSYLIRRHWITFSRLGSLRSWMAFHVFTGLTAGALVLFHSTFYPRSALGVLAFGAMAIVVATGLIGRYIYAHTPRSLEGKELELSQLQRRLEDYRQRLQVMGLPSDFFKLSPQPEVHGSDRSLPAALFSLLAGDRSLRREQRQLRSYIQRSPTLHPLARQAVPLALTYLKERQWVVRYNELRGLMGGWRFLHRWLAILLTVAVAFHIYIAFRLGNLWILNYLR